MESEQPLLLLTKLTLSQEQVGPSHFVNGRTVEATYSSFIFEYVVFPPHLQGDSAIDQATDNLWLGHKPDLAIALSDDEGKNLWYSTWNDPITAGGEALYIAFHWNGLFDRVHDDDPNRVTVRVDGLSVPKTPDLSYNIPERISWVEGIGNGRGGRQDHRRRSVHHATSRKEPFAFSLWSLSTKGAASDYLTVLPWTMFRWRNLRPDLWEERRFFEEPPLLEEPIEDEDGAIIPMPQSIAPASKDSVPEKNWNVVVTLTRFLTLGNVVHLQWLLWNRGQEIEALRLQRAGLSTHHLAIASAEEKSRMFLAVPAFTERSPVDHTLLYPGEALTVNTCFTLHDNGIETPGRFVPAEPDGVYRVRFGCVSANGPIVSDAITFVPSVLLNPTSQPQDAWEYR